MLSAPTRCPGSRRPRPGLPEPTPAAKSTVENSDDSERLTPADRELLQHNRATAFAGPSSLRGRLFLALMIGSFIPALLLLVAFNEPGGAEYFRLDAAGLIGVLGYGYGPPIFAVLSFEIADQAHRATGNALLRWVMFLACCTLPVVGAIVAAVLL